MGPLQSRIAEPSGAGQMSELPGAQAGPTKEVGGSRVKAAGGSCPSHGSPNAPCAFAYGLVSARLAPTMLVDGSARLLTANPAAQSVLRQGLDWSLDINNRVQRGNPAASIQLHQWIEAVGRGSATTGARAAHAITPTRESRETVVVRSVEITRSGEDDTPNSNAVLLTISNGSWRHDAESSRLLSETLSLTPTETRLAIALLEGHSLKSFAQIANLQVPTVRWHLHNLLSKTGCSNQRDFLLLSTSLIEY